MEKEYNYGLCLLKIWMAFEVVYLHSGGPFSIWMITAVPVFMILSFSLATKGILNDVRARMVRLVIPYVFWFVLCVALKSYPSQLWFQWELLILTLLVWALYKFIGRVGTLAVTGILSAGGLYMEYTGLDVKFQSWVYSKSSFFIILDSANLMQMMPFVFVGLILYETKLLDKARKKRWIRILAAAALLAFHLIHPMSFMSSGWLYGGLGHIWTAFLLIIIFGLFPFEMLGDTVKKGIRLLGRYTMGIYMCHVLIKDIYESVFSDMRAMLHGRKEAVLVFAVSWVLCFLIDKGIKKYGRMLVV